MTCPRAGVFCSRGHQSLQPTTQVGKQGTLRPAHPQDQQPARGEGWLTGREPRSPAMPAAAAAEGQPVALSLAERAVCTVVYGAPRPRPLLLPVGLELWLYVQKMRNLQRKRSAGSGG